MCLIITFLLYSKIKELREAFIKSGQEPWSNVTIIIRNSRFRIEYDYENLKNSDFTSYERHIIWRYKYLEIGPEQVNKKDKEILKRYTLGAKKLNRREVYEFGIYIKDVKNIVDYNNTEEYDNEIPNSEIETDKKEEKNISKNQILLSQEEIKKMKKYKLY